MTDIPAGYARVNVTYKGQQGELTDPVLTEANEDTIRQWVAEALRGGDIAGIDPVPTDDAIALQDFVVERFPARVDIPYARISLRPKTAFGKARMTHVEWAARAAELYGKDPRGWKFRCPACGHQQSIAEALERNPELDEGAAQAWIYFACEGRFNDQVGCNWALGGLLQIHERVVEPDRKVFLFADDEPERPPFYTPKEKAAA